MRSFPHDSGLLFTQKVTKTRKPVMATALQLETRSCKCGCGNTFKVLPTSRNFYVGKSHEPGYTGVAYGFSMSSRNLTSNNFIKPKDQFGLEIIAVEKLESFAPEYSDDPEDTVWPD